MSEKIYLHLLILCGILSQGIIATLSDEDPKESSDLLVRKRRVINHLPNGSTPMRIENVNYIVNIRENNRAVCAGVILSIYNVITAAACITYHHVLVYTVSAGAAYYQNHSLHNVTSQVRHYGNPPHQHFDGIALLTVNPPFLYGRKIKNINVYVGPLPIGTHVTVFGWGCIYPPQPGPGTRAANRRILRSITPPIMNHEVCQNVYREHNRQLSIPFDITEKHICTYDPQQYCARTDVGAPLVFNNMLVGIHAWKGEFQGGRNPDVFINLQRPEYSAWIRQNTRYA